MEGQSVDYRMIFSAMPGNSALLLPDSPVFTIVAATSEMAGFAGVPKEKLVNAGVFDSFPDNPELNSVINNIRSSLNICLSTKAVHKLDKQRYDIANEDGHFREMYWNIIHTPVLDGNGEVAYIIHTADNITESVLSEIKDERIRSLEPAHELFRQSSVAIHIFTGEELIIELANEPTLSLWDRDASIIGKPLLEVLPEIASQPYPGIIREVLRTGVPYHAYEAKVLLHRNGRDDTGYFNFILQPYYSNDNDRPIGVIAMANEVTKFYQDRISLAEKERSLELAVEIGDLGTFSISIPGRELVYSPRVMKWFGLSEPDAGIETLLSKIHLDDLEMVRETISLLSSGQRGPKQSIVFRVVDEVSGAVHYIRSIAKLQMQNDVPVSLTGIMQDVTDMIKSREEVNQSEQRLRSVIESAPFPIAVYTGEEMRVTMANQSLMDVWGKGNDVLGKTYFEVLPELAGTGIFETLGRVYRSGEAYHAQNSRVDLVMNGKLQPFWFNYSFTPLFDSNGDVYGVMNTAADVTDLNLAKQKVEESEYRYRTLIENSSIAAALYTGRDLRIQYANDIMINYWGKGEKVIGLALAEALPELKGQPFLDMLDRVFTKGETVSGLQQKASLEIDGKLKDFYFNYTYKPLHDANNEIYGIHHMAADVTAEVLAQKAIEESARNFRNMILLAPVAICVMRGENFVFDIVNPIMAELFGKERSFVEGKPLFEAMQELKGENLVPKLEAVLKEGKTFIIEEQEFHLPRKGEISTVYVNYIYEPMIDASGNIDGIMAVATDVTQQVLARHQIQSIVASRTRELAEANQLLENSNAELKQFAYIASHDLQEPLRKISMFSQRLQETIGTSNVEATRNMERISVSVNRMSNLIRDVLGYSQLSREKVAYSKTDLNHIMRETLSDFDLILEEKAGKVIYAGLPTIEAIPLQMSQLFNNLVSNSLKYSRKEVPPEISITASFLSEEKATELNLPSRAGGYVEIVFSDNGIGFPQEYADKIFQIFQRLHGKMEYSGTGIGLAMCRKIAENHQGIIYANAVEGKGAAFTVVLPLKQ